MAVPKRSRRWSPSCSRFYGIPIPFRSPCRGDPEEGRLKYGGNSAVLKTPPEGGQLGFAWSGVKFGVTVIEIEGELDREWAAKVILEARPDE